MIIRKKKPLEYGRFFLATEADGEEDDVIKANTKIITVKPSNRLRINFIDDVPEEPEEEVDDINPEDSNEVQTDEPPSEVQEPVENEENQEVTPQNDENIQEPDQQTSPEVSIDGEPVEQSDDLVNQINIDNEEFEQNNDQNTDEPVIDNEEIQNDTTEPDQTNGPALDETPVDAGEQPVDTGDATAAPAETTTKGPGLEFESTRKYILFKEFENLLISLDNYAAKLENQLSDDYEKNQVFKVATKKIKEIYNLCYEYMMMKYEISSYIQSKFFYQNLYITTQSVFTMIEKELQHKITTKR